jgi:CBS domain containing-hemolysin-like protein
LLVEASQDAGLLQDAQEEVMVRTLDIGNRRIGDIMTPRTELDWVDVKDDRDEIVRTVLESPYEQMLVGDGSIDNLLGAVTKTDLLNQVLRGGTLDPAAVVATPLMVHEAMPIFKVLEQFKKTPVRLAVVVDEYGGIEGIVTQADLLEALAGDLPEEPGEHPDVVGREDGSLLIGGMAPVHATLDRLQVNKLPVSTRFHTIAGFALAQLGHLPVAGEQFTYEGWTFEIVDMDGRRIDKLLVRRTPTLEA